MKNLVMAEVMGFVFKKVESIVGKGENADYQHFLLFLQCFQKAPYPGSLKIGLCGEKVMQYFCILFKWEKTNTCILLKGKDI